jgi:hypothetical protein
MMMNKNVNPHLEDHASELTVKITELLISKNVPPNDLTEFLSKRNSDASDVWELIDQLVNLILRENGQFVSRETILQKIIYVDVLSALYTSDPASIPKFQESFQQTIRKLLTYEVYSTITIPIIDLDVGQDGFKFGNIILFPITEDLKETDLWKSVDKYFVGRSNQRFLSIAKLEVPGDAVISIQRSLESISEMLILLRGIGFPVVFRENYEVSQFGLLNEFPIWRNRFVKREIIKENYHLDYSKGDLTLTGKAFRPCNLHDDILQNVEPDLLKKLEEIFVSSSKTKMETKLFRGFQWIGEATKPDKIEAKVAKLVFGLEAMIGGEPSDENLATRGIIASIAERAAFLVGKDAPQRTQIDEEIRNFYKKRSQIVHGDELAGTEIDLEAASKLIRNVGWGLMKNLDQFTNIDQLQIWIRTMRYT